MISCSKELKALLLTGGYLNEEVEIIITTPQGVELVYTDADVKVGGLSWSKEASDNVGFELGWCDTTEVNLELLKQVNVSLYDSSLEIYFTYTLPSELKERYKIGTYYIPNGNVTLGIDSTKITAFSNTGKLKKRVDAGVSGSLYDLLVWSCNKCGVKFGMSEQELNLLSPATKYSYKVDLSTSIKNYSDIVMWVSQVLGGFVDCDVDGNIIINTFHKSYAGNYMNPISNPDWSYELGYVKEPEVGNRSYIVSGVQIEVGYFVDYKEEPTEVKTNYFNSVGYDYVIDNNPILEVIQLSDTQYKDIHDGMLDNIKYCNFREMENFILDNPFFELGDTVFSTDAEGNNLASCITSFKYTYNGNAILYGCPMADLYTQEKQSKQTASTSGYEGAVLNIIKTALVKDIELRDIWLQVASLDVSISEGISPIFSFVDCIDIKQGGAVSARLRYDGVYHDSVMIHDVYKFRDKQTLALVYQWVLPAGEVSAVHNVLLEMRYEKYESVVGGVGAILRESDWGTYLMASGAKYAGAEWTGVFDVTDMVDFSLKPIAIFGKVIEGIVDIEIKNHDIEKEISDETDIAKVKNLLGQLTIDESTVVIDGNNIEKPINSDALIIGKVASVFGNISETIGSNFF